MIPSIIFSLVGNLYREVPRYGELPPGWPLTWFTQADAGLTGRKIIVDTYGGWGAHGGGAFSGKDPSKVDRSACYAARWIAKSLVHAKLAKRVLVQVEITNNSVWLPIQYHWQVSYAIGHPEPLAIYVDSYNSSDKSDDELIAIIKKNFDLRPGVLIKWVPYIIHVTADQLAHVCFSQGVKLTTTDLPTYCMLRTLWTRPWDVSMGETKDISIVNKQQI